MEVRLDLRVKVCPCEVEPELAVGTGLVEAVVLRGPRDMGK
jgi:hypothetical protein